MPISVPVHLSCQQQTPSLESAYQRAGSGHAAAPAPTANVLASAHEACPLSLSIYKKKVTFISSNRNVEYTRPSAVKISVKMKLVAFQIMNRYSKKKEEKNI